MRDANPTFQPSGKFPSSVDQIIIRYSGSAMIYCSSFNTLAADILDPGDSWIHLAELFGYISSVHRMSTSLVCVRLLNLSRMLFTPFSLNIDILHLLVCCYEITIYFG